MKKKSDYIGDSTHSLYGQWVLLRRETTFVRVLFIFYLIASLICLFLIPFFGFINKIKDLFCVCLLCVSVRNVLSI